jgi:hypothetical protein
MAWGTAARLVVAHGGAIAGIFGVRFGVPLLCTFPLCIATFCKGSSGILCNTMIYADDCDTMQVAEKG